MTDIHMAAPGGRRAARAVGLAVLVAAADALLWQVGAPRLSLVALGAVVLGIAHLARREVPGRRGALGWAGFAVGALPVVEEAQALSVLSLWLGLLFGLACLSAAPVGRAMARLPMAGLWRDGRDLWAAGTALSEARLARGALRRELGDWGPAVALGVVFAAMFAVANPLLDDLAQRLFGRFGEIELPVGRVVFWTVAAMWLWPALRLSAMAGILDAPAPATGLAAPDLLSPRSVARALVTFNLLFAVQSVSDVAYLWGGVRLPEGMTYAGYAHRGAYPLVLTVLLAGAFALAAGRHARAPALRGLLLAWVAQNVLLMASSVLRLDLYVDAYGLTRLRVAAFVWMGVVAAGLLLMPWQIARGLPPGWLVRRAVAVGAAATWACLFVNVAGLVARDQLGREGEIDAPYVCGLGPGALPAILEWQAAEGQRLCVDSWTLLPVVRPPEDWREWGYRNWRLRRSLAALEGPAVPRQSLREEGEG
ncbi:DUF4153 domain-containing protein [Wenxinia marina]|uniref:DUF4173 domain-containing protein n=1 Tax=Wenxinia marina DSM 24838 TaxID=1123501 RepID=A0A0D0Q7C9_9RHOB|nr:DUF4173 domain-containing protein [Wenxinia marina]KIQ68377.1 hypothetical protein Wenmar_03024 [Wenxinia marina DSM 24838]GGL72695.1 hypothetical protein GCM10011392_29120 [Wenxinia marina]